MKKTPTAEERFMQEIMATIGRYESRKRGKRIKQDMAKKRAITRLFKA